MVVIVVRVNKNVYSQVQQSELHGKDLVTAGA